MSKIIPIIQERTPLNLGDVADDHRWTFDQRGMDFDKDLGLTGKYCYHPFNTITIDGNGDVFMCVCESWLPISVGKIWEFDSFDEIAHSTRATELQESILDGTYKYCDNNTCGVIKTGALNNSMEFATNSINKIVFAIDSSCNLTCPSCRTEFKFTSEGPEFEFKIKMAEHIAMMMNKHDNYSFLISGDGDPFASLVYRHLLTILQLNNKAVNVEIMTNGILAKQHWHKLSGVHSRISNVTVSFDAGCEETYNITRRGGDWKKLLENVEFLTNLKKLDVHRNMKVISAFVVQTSNYKDMPAYVKICDELGVDVILFQKIVDWSTLDNFEKHAVWHPDHEEHQEFLTILNSLDNSKVNFTNVL